MGIVYGKDAILWRTTRQNLPEGDFRAAEICIRPFLQPIAWREAILLCLKWANNNHAQKCKQRTRCKIPIRHADYK